MPGLVFCSKLAASNMLHTLVAAAANHAVVCLSCWCLCTGSNGHVQSAAVGPQGAAWTTMMSARRSCRQGTSAGMYNKTAVA